MTECSDESSKFLANSRRQLHGKSQSSHVIKITFGTLRLLSELQSTKLVANCYQYTFSTVTSIPFQTS